MEVCVNKNVGMDVIFVAVGRILIEHDIRDLQRVCDRLITYLLPCLWHSRDDLWSTIPLGL
jgi:hypothetical protein